MGFGRIGLRRIGAGRTRAGLLGAGSGLVSGGGLVAGAGVVIGAGLASGLGGGVVVGDGHRDCGAVPGAGAGTEWPAPSPSGLSEDVPVVVRGNAQAV
ncbi:hypothetical protein Skr01_18400 [Sphaerisporangium krabiense]|nr:hypothetical protein Skr01_18400 [Sphaerisporangium krabiense]